MGRKRSAGLRKRDGVWHIEKQFLGIKIFESCRTSDLTEAETYLTKRLNEIREAKLLGVRPKRIWREAAAYYLEVKKKRSLADDAKHLLSLDEFIGNLPIVQVHDGTLEPFKQECRRRGLKTKSINLALGVVRHILNLCAKKWRDKKTGLTWIQQAPAITLEPVEDDAKPYPLSWDEQAKLFPLLPGHLQRMALFKVNTGTREMEVCLLQWDWEIPVPEIGRSVFLIPEGFVKNAEERLVMLNDVAWSVIEGQRGLHPKWVFPYGQKWKGNKKKRRSECEPGPLYRMNNTAWQRAWRKAGLPISPEWKKGVHNLKHTFGRRLRAAGISRETRKVLLGHTNNDITSHYSAAELQELLSGANLVCNRSDSGKTPALTLLVRRRLQKTA